MTEARSATMLAPAEERRLAAELFNHVWELLETGERTEELDDRLIHAAHASRFHWGNVGGPVNVAIGEWQCSRVYSVLGRAEPALFHAERCLRVCEGAGLDGFPLAEAYEALARAHLFAGDRGDGDRYRALAWEAAERIDDAEDREVFARDMATLPT
jgi:hypothetical protein